MGPLITKEEEYFEKNEQLKILKDKEEVYFAENEAAYIPNLGRLTKDSKSWALYWKKRLGDKLSQEKLRQSVISTAIKVFDNVEKSHKKCTIRSEYGITRDAGLQHQIERAWSDAVALFSPDPDDRQDKKLSPQKYVFDVVEKDLRAIAPRIKENDFNSEIRETDFFQVYKECSKANGSQSYDAFMKNPSVPKAWKRELEAIET